MQSEPIVIKAARDAASTTLGNAVAELHKAAEAIARRFELPEGINGLSAGEFLGRTSFVVSMHRELKRAGEEMIAARAIKQTFKQEQAAKQPAAKPAVDTVKVEGTPAPDGKAKPLPSADITSLKITVQAVKALKGAGIHQVSDLENITDTGLLAIDGIAAASAAKIRQALAEYGT